MSLLSVYCILRENNSIGFAKRTWPAPAKLNLFLHIVDRHKGGYHVLQSLVQFIDLYDQLSFSVRSDGKIKCRNSDSTISQEEDLSVRAATLLQRFCAVRQGVNIQINKVVPAGTGLGGGSSDAATTLLVLNRMWNCGLKLERLEGLARRLGSDVLVFIRGTASWMEGTGERLLPVLLSEPWYVVVFTGVLMSTRQMFEHPDLTRDCTPITIKKFTWQDTCNVFEPIARQQHPKVEHAFRWLGQYADARLTGSGSALFAKFDTWRQAQEVVTACPREFTARVVKGLNCSPLCSLCGYNSV